MNAILYGLKKIRQAIPLEILNVGINLDVPRELVHTSSTDEKIVSKIIRPIVLVDTNIVGGIEVDIQLSGIPVKYDYYNNMIWHVPMERTMNREIINPIGIGSVLLGAPPVGMGMPTGAYGSNSMGSAGCFTATYASTQGDRIINSHSSSYSDFNPNVELIGPNTVLLHGANFLGQQALGLKAIIEHDNNLNDLQPRAYEQFSNLCVLAAKMHLYNTLVIAMGRGYLDGGQDLGPFQSIVESYDGAFAEYHEYLTETWGRVMLQNDTRRKERFLGMITNSNI